MKNQHVLNVGKIKNKTKKSQQPEINKERDKKYEKHIINTSKTIYFIKIELKSIKRKMSIKTK